ncbi:transglycosylase SLT domain-containing protein [Azospirillum sp. TSH64]|uniref:transglycosylase SLT domain-containing protein n=1 Tax=Azospirillum sp. TSH64 TaxID=652740 RepID=UPI0011B251BC|nr:transglycosylase SLT domain-containing protein [Azospirillum sp. TSH64]
MANTFQIVLTARDRASSVVNGVNSALSRVPPSLSRIGSAMERVGDTSVLDRLQKGAVGLARPVVDAARSVGVLNNSLGLVFGAGSIAGAGALVAHWGAVGVATGNAARGIGIAAGRLRTLRGAAELAGVGADEMTGSLGALATTLQDAAFGRNNEAAAMLNSLGIATRRTASGAVDAEAALGDLADAIAKQTNPQTQARIAGMFGVQALLPMLRKGRAGWSAYIKEVERLANVSEDTQKRSEDLGISLNKLEAAASGVGTTLESKLNSRFGALIDSTTEWISQNKELAADIALTGAAVVGLAAAGKGVAILTAGFSSLAAAMGGVLTGATALAAHPVIAALVGAVTVLTPSTANEGEDEILKRMKANGTLNPWGAQPPASQQQSPAGRADFDSWLSGLGKHWAGGSDGSGVGSAPTAVPPSSNGAVSSAGVSYRVRRWDPQVNALSAKYGIDPNFVRRIMQQESGGRQFGKDGLPLTSSAGAIGPMQVMPGTFADMARRYGIKGGITDPDANIEAGVAYLSEQLKRFGNETTAAAAYNAGPERVKDNIADGRPLPSETKKYIASIAAMERLQSQAPAGGEQKVNVTVTLGGNVPEGTAATAQTPSGNFVPTRIEYAMPSFARP